MNKESIETYFLAGIGGAQGFWRYYIRPEITAKRSWSAVLGFAALHDVICPKGQTLSEGVDRALERYPIATTLAIGYTTAHLLNVLPENFDILHQLTKLRNKL